ncbi:sxtJ [Thiohalocapsa marina]|uniref:SxtJ n=1 Tax=Thiohalocapsa marina TaxID=424902 RepID=A0A5M8FH70_9GAMM|nr:SxtJ family membrane protein [Thiohalocapsa marina]KAA6184049.1 sxtJ [Thiohalocapsa marina]
MQHVIPELDRKGLRQFALTTGAIVAGLFGLLLPWLFDFGFPLWPWPLAAVLVLWGLLAPNSLRPVYRGWMRIGLLLSRVTTPLILGLVFFLVFVPAGLVMRLTRYDPMRRRPAPQRDSYREPSRPYTPDSMENPY